MSRWRALRWRFTDWLHRAYWWLGDRVDYHWCRLQVLSGYRRADICRVCGEPDLPTYDPNGQNSYCEEHCPDHDFQNDGCAPPLNLEKRRRQQAAFDLLPASCRKLIAETPIDIDIDLLLQDYRREYAAERQRRAWESADGILPDDTPTFREDHMAAWLSRKIQDRANAALRKMGFEADYKPLVSRGKQRRQETADGRRHDRKG